MSSVNYSTVTAAGGMFTITDANGNSTEVDLGTLVMMINLETTENLDQQIALKLEEMQQRNDEIATMTEFMSQCRQRQASYADDGAANHIDGTSQNMTINGITKPVQGEGSWSEEFGIGWTDVIWHEKPNKDEKAEMNAAWDANIEAISGQIDMMNNDSQMDNIELQNLLDKRNNAFQMATQVLQSNNESVEATLRNL